MKTKWYIYALSDPRTPGVFRYVGKTVDREGKRTGPTERLNCHINECRRITAPRGKWIASLLEQSLKPVMSILEDGGEEIAWQPREQFWIQALRRAGCDLLNRTDGGDGIHEWKPSRWSVIKRTGIPLSKEHREKISKANKGRPVPQERRERISRALIGSRHTEETKRKMSATRKGRPIPLGQRQKISRSHVGIRPSAETIEKLRIAAVNMSLETRAKIGAASKGRVASAETRLKLSIVHKGKKKPPEAIAKQRATQLTKPGVIKRGEDNCWHKLTAEQVIEMRRLHVEQGFGARRLSKIFDVSRSTCKGIIDGKRWRSVLPMPKTEEYVATA